MSFTTRNLYQIATHWVAISDGYGGFTFTTPQILQCRWEDRNETVRAPNGEEVTAKSVVILKNDISIGDYLYLGESEELDPTTLLGAQRVMMFNRITDLRNINVSRVAYL
jgi:hypothetical protein